MEVLTHNQCTRNSQFCLSERRNPKDDSFSILLNSSKAISIRVSNSILVVLKYNIEHLYVMNINIVLIVSFVSLKNNLSKITHIALQTKQDFKSQIVL